MDTDNDQPMPPDTNASLACDCTCVAEHVMHAVNETQIKLDGYSNAAQEQLNLIAADGDPTTPEAIRMMAGRYAMALTLLHTECNACSDLTRELLTVMEAMDHERIALRKKCEHLIENSIQKLDPNPAAPDEAIN